MSIGFANTPLQCEVFLGLPFFFKKKESGDEVHFPEIFFLACVCVCVWGEAFVIEIISHFF